MTDDKTVLVPRELLVLWHRVMLQSTGEYEERCADEMHGLLSARPAEGTVSDLEAVARPAVTTRESFAVDALRLLMGPEAFAGWERGIGAVEAGAQLTEASGTELTAEQIHEICVCLDDGTYTALERKDFGALCSMALRTKQAELAESDSETWLVQANANTDTALARVAELESALAAQKAERETAERELVKMKAYAELASDVIRRAKITGERPS